MSTAGDGIDRVDHEEEVEVESAPERATLVLLVLCGAQLLVALTITIVLVGGAAIKDSIDIADGDVHWLVTSYALAFGGLVLLSGRIGDTVGHRRMFLIGLGLFGLTSLGVALSESTTQIIVARALQGVAAAMVSPATLALLTESFVGTRQRARAFGAWSLAGSGGGVIGYLAGGAVIDSFGWRWAFAVNLPLALLGVLAGRALVPATTNRRPAEGFDIPGAVAISGAAFALVYGFGRAQADGWLAATTLGSIAISFVLVLVFLAVETRAAQPLIPIRLIKRRQFSANVVTLCSGATVSGTLLVASLFLQEERGYTARDAGLSTLPVPIGVAIGAKLTSSLMRRRPGSKGFGIAVTGQLLTASGFALAAVRITSESYATSFLPAWLLMGIGLSMSSIPMVSYATSDVGPNDRGIVSGIFNMAQQLGAALGVAALWTVTHSARSQSGGASAAVDAARTGFLVATAIALANATFTACVVSGRFRGDTKIVSRHMPNSYSERMTDNPGSGAGSDWRARVVGRSLAPAADKAVRRGQQLIAAASQLILESGADDFTVQQVASQAGLSLRAFYQHFEGKDDLLIALIEESNVVLAELLDHHADRFEQPLERLGSALYFSVDPRQHTPSSYNAASTRFTIRTSLSAPAALARARRPVVEAYARLIDEAMAVGALERTSPERASFWLIASQTSYSRALYIGNDLTEELPSRSEFVRFCVDGLGSASSARVGAAVRDDRRRGSPLEASDAAGRGESDASRPRVIENAVSD